MLAICNSMKMVNVNSMVAWLTMFSSFKMVSLEKLQDVLNARKAMDRHWIGDVSSVT